MKIHLEIRNDRLLAGLGVLIAGMALGWAVKAVADGVPQMAPLQYSGTVIENERPVTGMRDVTVALYDAVAGGSEKCKTNAQHTSVNGGRFRVTLGADCLSAVRTTPELWAEVSVGGTVLPRRKLGTVPYAVEAERAFNAGGTLAGTISSMESRLGAVEKGVGRFMQTGYVGADVNTPNFTLNSGAGERSMEVRVNFPTAFSRAPVVSMAISAVAGTSTIAVAQVKNVEATGFTAVFGTWADTRISTIWGSWTAYLP